MPDDLKKILDNTIMKYQAILEKINNGNADFLWSLYDLLRNLQVKIDPYLACAYYLREDFMRIGKEIAHAKLSAIYLLKYKDTPQKNITLHCEILLRKILERINRTFYYKDNKYFYQDH